MPASLSKQYQRHRPLKKHSVHIAFILPYPPQSIRVLRNAQDFTHSFKTQLKNSIDVAHLPLAATFVERQKQHRKLPKVKPISIEIGNSYLRQPMQK